MAKNENIKKLAGVAAFVIWSAIVLAGFYIVQNPLIFQVIDGATATLWAITLLIILLINSAGLGYFTLTYIQPRLAANERLILGTGLGLGMLGLLGYGLGAAGLSTPLILALFLFGILVSVFIFKIHINIYLDLKSLANSFRENRNSIPIWLPWAIFYTCVLGFLFALLPPADGFDGLFYHLRMPELLLADGRILPHNILQFWFPSLLEGDFLWALGLGAEQTAQLIHWSFSIFVFALIWEWSRQVFGYKPAWWALAVLISMPSLTWLSAWAYTDMALTFFSLACLYTLWRWRENNEMYWLLISGLFTGMAMGIKYTSFIVPILGIVSIVFYERTLRTSIPSIMKYSLSALFVSLPWYLRNWLMMGNPFYPFVFGGRYWDAFRSDWYSGAGTGIGWNFREILLLPFTITLGYRDQNYYDGRLGPLFLLLLPFALWIILAKRSAPASEHNALFILSTFAILNYFFWVFSVIQTVHLWQSRLLFPGLIPFSMVIGLGIANMEILNLPRLRISSITTTLMGLVIMITLVNNSLSLVARRPLAYALGIESRKDYFQRIQPNYAEALNLVETAPNNAYVYFLFEPRSYYMPRNVQPDAINDNLAHDYYLFKTSAEVIKDWKLKGYTHILVYNKGLDFFAQKDGGEVTKDQFTQTIKYLRLEKTFGNYTLYSIP